jgi:hypothetical protein
MSATWRSVIVSPFGTPSTYSPIVSLRESLWSPASCINSVPMNVLVTEPMR